MKRAGSATPQTKTSSASQQQQHQFNSAMAMVEMMKSVMQQHGLVVPEHMDMADEDSDDLEGEHQASERDEVDEDMDELDRTALESELS
eukprot:1844715-Amphidinium_carterae.5